MTFESSQRRLDSEDVIEPAKKLATITQEKNIQRQQQDGNQNVSQTTHDLSVVIPTRNEHDNILPLLKELHNALHDLRVEVIFVDDSDDDTPKIIEYAAETNSASWQHIRLEHRLPGNARSGGLATAVVHGMNRAQAEYIAVLDADLQHPPDLLRVLYKQAVAQNADLVLASRYIKGGSYQGLDGIGRRCISIGFKWMAKLLFPERLLRISDPLGGFFLLRSSLLADVSLHPIGYKILLEVLLRCQWQRVLEVPYHFRARTHGQSKADIQQGIRVLQHMMRLYFEVTFKYQDKQNNGSQEILLETPQSNRKQEALPENGVGAEISNGHKRQKRKPVALTQLEKDILTGSSSFTPLQRPPARVKRRRLPIIISAILLVALILTSVRLNTVVSDSNDQLLVQLADQQACTVDLRQAFPISPYLFGANVFPATGTSSQDQALDGFMNYGHLVSRGLRDASIKLLRFPGGNWGEEHVLSYAQLNSFSTLLTQVGAAGMIQANLGGQTGTGLLPNQSGTALLPYQPSLHERANLAGQWVDYMNNPRSPLRVGPYANAPFHPVKFWTVGNEPDLLLNLGTGKRFTVQEYTNAFIQFSIAMHQNNPTIQVFGPEISQFYGVNVGPKDATGQLWMEGFLQGIGAYEKAHPELKFHLLDGVSFHRYPLSDTTNSPGILLSSTDEWTYLLPPLRQLIWQNLGRDAPVAVTEINTNPTKDVPTPGLASLWWADTLASLMSQQVEYVAFFSAEGVDIPYALFTSKLDQTAMMRVMQMFSHLQHNYIPVGIQHNPISLYATQDDPHQTVSLMFINKFSTIQSVHISVKNQFFGLTNWPDTSVSLFGNSIIVVTLHRNGGADAYSYKVPTNENSAVNPVNFTVCGHDPDVLSNDRPC